MKYGQKVKVTSGFYEDNIGVLVMPPNNNGEYYVGFIPEGTQQMIIAHIPESNLEIIK